MDKDKIITQFPKSIMPYRFGEFDDPTPEERVREYIIKNGSITDQKIKDVTGTRVPSDFITFLRRTYKMDIYKEPYTIRKIKHGRDKTGTIWMLKRQPT